MMDMTEEHYADPPLSVLERRLAWAALGVVVIFVIATTLLWFQFAGLVSAAPVAAGWRLFICH